MKKLSIYFSVLVLFVTIFNNCKKVEVEDIIPDKLVKGCYIVNFGNYGTGGASISKYDYETGEMSNFYYQAQNGGTELLSNIEYAYHYNDSIFLLGNEADQIITVNTLFEQSLNGITKDIAKPRFCVAEGNYLYVSCWGENPDWLKMPDTYIAKYNIATRTIEKKISLPGGPEGLEFAHGKLYAALNFKDSVAVIDINDESISYIETPAVTSYFIKDNSDNLYTTLINTYTRPAIQTGIGYINTTNDQLESVYNLENVSTNYGSVIKANAALSKIYVLTSAYDANWNISGAVAEFDVADKSFNSNNIISNISGISGLAVNPADNDIYVFTSESTISAGLMKIYSASGDFVKELEVGASPVWAFFLE